MNRIRDLRTAAGWTQAQLGVKLNVGNTAISQYETEERQLTPALIHTLCDLFGCTSDYLLGRSQSLQPVLTDQQVRLLEAYEAADPDHQAIVHLALRLDSAAEKKKAV